MKLLFDANLAPTLAHSLSDIYPNSAHVLGVGLPLPPTDEAIWTYAKSNGFVVATKDADFDRMSSLYGAPPKVIWLRIGNSPTAIVEALLRGANASLLAFENDATAEVMALGSRVAKF